MLLADFHHIPHEWAAFLHESLEFRVSQRLVDGGVDALEHEAEFPHGVVALNGIPVYVTYHPDEEVRWLAELSVEVYLFENVALELWRDQFVGQDVAGELK